MWKTVLRATDCTHCESVKRTSLTSVKNHALAKLCVSVKARLVSLPSSSPPPPPPPSRLCCCRVRGERNGADRARFEQTVHRLLAPLDLRPSRLEPLDANSSRTVLYRHWAFDAWIWQNFHREVSSSEYLWRNLATTRTLVGSSKLGRSSVVTATAMQATAMAVVSSSTSQ